MRFLWWVQVFTFVFGSQSAIRAIANLETEASDEKRQPYENFIQIASKKVEAYHPCLTKPFANCKVLYGSPHHEEHKAIIMS